MNFASSSKQTVVSCDCVHQSYLNIGAILTQGLRMSMMTSIDGGRGSPQLITKNNLNMGMPIRLIGNHKTQVNSTCTASIAQHERSEPKHYTQGLRMSTMASTACVLNGSPQVIENRNLAKKRPTPNVG